MLKGHSGDPWNEFADKICEHISNEVHRSLCNVHVFIGNNSAFPISAWMQAGNHYVSDWAFLGFLPKADRIQYPPADHSGFF